MNLRDAREKALQISAEIEYGLVREREAESKLYRAVRGEAIEPVSVVDRLPKLSDSDAEELCWWWRTDADGSAVEGMWEMLQFDFPARRYNSSESGYNYTHWLPHWAIVNPNAPLS
jgi:hypothetical protein